MQGSVGPLRRGPGGWWKPRGGVGSWRLPVEFAGNLDVARVVPLGVAHQAEPRVAQRRIRKAEPGCVERVERFHAELEGEALVQRKRFEDRGVHHAGAHFAALRPLGAVDTQSAGRPLDPGDGLRSAGAVLADAVRVHRARVEVVAVGIVRAIYELVRPGGIRIYAGELATGLEKGDQLHLPAAERRFHQAPGVVKERDLVAADDRQTVWQVFAGADAFELVVAKLRIEVADGLHGFGVGVID